MMKKGNIKMSRWSSQRFTLELSTSFGLDHGSTLYISLGLFLVFSRIGVDTITSLCVMSSSYLFYGVFLERGSDSNLSRSQVHHHLDMSDYNSNNIFCSCWSFCYPVVVVGVGTHTLGNMKTSQHFGLPTPTGCCYIKWWLNMSKDGESKQDLFWCLFSLSLYHIKRTCSR